MNPPTTEATVERICRRAGEIKGDVATVVAEIVETEAPLADPRERAELMSRAVARLDGLDELQSLLLDAAVDEVMVNRNLEVWIDRDGRLERRADLRPGVADVVLERVLAPIGRRLDRSNPVVDARLPDGARLCAVVAPVAIDGTTMSIRRHRRRRVPLAAFSTPEVCEVLADLVRRRSNVLITGATSSGKTTLLSGLTDLLEPCERLVLIEDTSELVLDGDQHAVRLEAHPAGVDGGAATDVSALVRTALRLRPDRLIVGEFRGHEVLAVVEAMNTGHDGSMSTCHANSAVDGLRRVETLVMQAAPAWPLAAIRRQVTRSIDAVVHVGRDLDGRRRIVEIVEVIESGDDPSASPLVAGDRVIAWPERSRR